VPALDLGHPLDRGGIDAADGEIQGDPAEDPDARDNLADDVGE
jgi:hypothetical protein